MITTLNKIRAHRPCREGWEKLLRHLGKTAADDALWCLRAVEGRDREIRLYAVWAARQVQHLMTDPRSFTALDVAEEYARGRASTVELREAWAAAWAMGATGAAAVEVAADAADAAAYAARQAGAAKATQANELRRICQEIEAGRDPYPEEDGR